MILSLLAPWHLAFISAGQDGGREGGEGPTCLAPSLGLEPHSQAAWLSWFFQQL